MINVHYHGKADYKLIQTMNMSELNILYQKKYLIIWIFLQQLCTNFCTLFILLPSVITVSQEKGIHSFFLQKVSLPITHCLSTLYKNVCGNAKEFFYGGNNFVILDGVVSICYPAIVSNFI